MLTSMYHRLRRPRHRSSRSVRRLLEHDRLRGSTLDERNFMARLDLEIERARRHERPFAMTRFAVQGGSSVVDDSLIAVGSRIRACDIATVLDGEIVVLWAETGSAEVERAIRRVTRTSGGTLGELNSVVFPDTALTRSALLGRLFAAPTSSPVEAARVPTLAGRGAANSGAGTASDDIRDAAS